MRDRLDVDLVPYAAGSSLLEDALAVYGRVWPDRDPEVARESFTRYAGYLDFHGLVALREGSAVGVGYGARSYPGIWWHDQAAGGLGSDHPALQDAWRMVELAVLPDHQGHGIGARLHDALLAAQPCPRVLLSTGVDNLRALTMYRRRGWYSVHDAFPFPGQPHPYAILGKEL